ncbi:MAG TPA: lipoprotein [Acidocella sp.]|nr:lipoprotein [Acidocella sp.]
MRVALAMLCVLALAGCGRRGTPVPPGPASAITYPHTYPAQ